MAENRFREGISVSSFRNLLPTSISNPSSKARKSKFRSENTLPPDPNIIPVNNSANFAKSPPSKVLTETLTTRSDAPRELEVSPPLDLPIKEIDQEFDEEEIAESDNPNEASPTLDPSVKKIDQEFDEEEIAESNFRNEAAATLDLSVKATIPGFLSTRLSIEEAENLLKKSVKLAVEALDKFWDANGMVPGKNYNCALVAAYIGSYGAYVADGSEYRHVLSCLRKKTSKSTIDLLHFSRLCECSIRRVLRNASRY